MLFTVLRRYFFIAVLLQVAVVSAYAGSHRACVAHVVLGESNPPTLRPAVPVTGELENPLPYVLANLGLASWTPEEWALVSRVTSKPELVLAQGLSQDAARALVPAVTPSGYLDVASLGEGHSGLVPFLLRNQHRATAIDKAYGSGVDAHRTPDDATRLELLDADSQDLLVSHGLMAHLTGRERIAMIARSFEKLKAGGEMRHSLSVRIPVPTDNPRPFAQAVQSLVERALPGQDYQLAVFLDQTAFEYAGRFADVHALVDLRAPWNERTRTSETASAGPLRFADLKRAARPLADPKTNVLIVVRKHAAETADTFLGGVEEAAPAPLVADAKAEAPAQQGWVSWFTFGLLGN